MTTIEPSALVKAFSQLPEFTAQLLFERLNQPFRQVVAMTLHQIRHIDLFTLIEPVGFLVGQGAAQEVTWAVKPEDRHSSLFWTTARGRIMVKQEFFAEHGVHGARQGGAFARAQTPVVTKKFRNNGVGGMVKFER